jgi:hypothetical protein
MDARRFTSIVFALAVAVAAMAPASSSARGPEVPCTGYANCERNVLFHSPASGFWGNPEEVGIALHLFVQNRVMFGTFYGYTETGAPAWYLFTARLERPQGRPGVLVGRTTLEEYNRCAGCESEPPRQVALHGSIELEFDQRNHGTYRLRGGEPVHIVPLFANSVFADHFADEMHYALPDPEGAWVISFLQDVPFGSGSYEQGGSMAGMFEAKEVSGGVQGVPGRPGMLRWAFTVGSAGSEPFEAASLECEATAGSPPAPIPPECVLYVRVGMGGFPEFRDGVAFPLPYANIGDGRIVSRDPQTGIRLEAFRIGHD